MKLYTFIASAALLAAATLIGSLRQATVASGGLIKGSLPAVYYVGGDGYRYVFPSDKTYFTWYSDFSGVNVVSDEELASYPIGGNVTYKPGAKLVKIQSDPKVYAVSHAGVLRWVKTAEIAVALYGDDWSKKVEDLPDSFFVNYTIGSPIAVAGDYNIANEQMSSPTINADKPNIHSPSENANANDNANVPPGGNQEASGACVPACSLGNACVTNACQAVPGPSALKVTAFVIESLDTCFVGDPCAGGSCCTIAGNQFADNDNLKAVRPADKYLYADKQQLCGRAVVSAINRNRITQEFSDFANAAAADSDNRVFPNVSQYALTGNFTMSRVPGSCNWWVSPDDLRERLANQVDSSTDSVFIVSSRDFDFGAVDEPDSRTVDQTVGLGGAGYTYLVKEWETDTSGAPDHSLFTSAFTSQMNSSVDLGITDPATSFVGNHCRDGRRDFDETGVDCGGLGCTACVY